LAPAVGSLLCNSFSRWADAPNTVGDVETQLAESEFHSPWFAGSALGAVRCFYEKQGGPSFFSGITSNPLKNDSNRQANTAINTLACIRSLQRLHSRTYRKWCFSRKNHSFSDVSRGRLHRRCRGFESLIAHYSKLWSEHDLRVTSPRLCDPLSTELLVFVPVMLMRGVFCGTPKERFSRA
jgi:hypothetical protein